MTYLRLKWDKEMFDYFAVKHQIYVIHVENFHILLAILSLQLIKSHPRDIQVLNLCKNLKDYVIILFILWCY